MRKNHWSGVRYLVMLLLGAVLSQSGVQELVLLCGLDHPTSAQGDEGDYRVTHATHRQYKQRSKVGCFVFHLPVESELTNCLQDVNLTRFSELLTTNTAGYKTTCPAYTCTEERRGDKSRGEEILTQ